jgi:uncharacterized protein YkwD
MSRLCLPGYLLIALLVAADKQESEPTPSLTKDEKAILELTNKTRAEKKLAPLSIDPLLTRAARAHSANMAKQAEMNHVLDGKNPSDRVKATGYVYRAIGENIARGENVTIQQIFDGWMNSKPHRDNILQSEYQEIGIAIAQNDKGEVYYTQVFGTKRRR